MGQGIKRVRGGSKMQSNFIDIEEWLNINGIELDKENDKIKCVNMPDDWHEEEEIEEEDEEE